MYVDNELTALLHYLSLRNGAGQGGKKEETKEDSSLHLDLSSGAWSCDSEEFFFTGLYSSSEP